LSRLEDLRQRVSDLRQTVERLREKARRTREAARREAFKREVAVYLDNFIIPYLEGIAERYGDPTLEDGVRRLIRKKSRRYPLRYRREEAVADMRRWLSQPQISVLLARVNPLINWKLSQISESLDFILDEVIAERYPYLHEAIVGEKGGREWFKTVVGDMIKLLRHLVRA